MPHGLDPNGADAGPPPVLDRWYAVLLRFVAPNGRPVRKALLLAPALLVLVYLPLVLLSAAPGGIGASETPPTTAGRIGSIPIGAPLPESFVVIGL